MSPTLTGPALLTAIDECDQAQPATLAERLDADPDDVARAIEPLFEADVVALAPRYGTYRLTRRGQLVLRRHESGHDVDLDALIESRGATPAVVDATAGP